MSELNLDDIHEILEAELRNEELERIPKTLYKDLASHIRLLKNNINRGGEDISSHLKDREIRLIDSLATRLLEIRIGKANKLGEVVDEGRLTPEEKYVLEALVQADKRLSRVKEAVRNGRARVLSRISEIIISRFSIVRFLQAMSSIVGVDLKLYGPFRTGDVVALPLENVRPLMKQGVVEEVWVED